jgi:uncharacterized protein (DUF697 family)/tellurite resistance protein
MHTNTVPTLEARNVLAICILAAFADGRKDERERDELKQMADGFGEGSINLASLYQDVLLKRVTLESATAGIATPDMKSLAHEMAVCVMDADGSVTEAERTFLEELRQRLGLDGHAAAVVEAEAEVIATAPLTSVVEPPLLPEGPDLDRMVLRYATTCGALELLPQSLASVAIIPMQMKMVYRIGKAHGYALDQRQIAELLGVLGLGLTSQAVEGVARKFLGKLVGRMAGGLGKSVARAGTSVAVSFASTYALGQVARQYYTGNRRLDALQLKTLFNSLTVEGRKLQARYQGEIDQQVRAINVPDLLSGKVQP